MTRERAFSSVEAAAIELASNLADCMREAIAGRGHALLAVSGGRTPRHVLARLRELEVDWSRVIVTLTDERWVPEEHPDSNAGLVRRTLLQGAAAAAQFVPLYGGEDTPVAGQPACEQRLGALPLPCDAMYLGMGADGHIASLFPGDEAVDTHGGLCVSVPEHSSRVARMSLTASAILDARKLFLLFSGADKQRQYERAKLPGAPRELPVRLLLAGEHRSLSVLSAP